MVRKVSESSMWFWAVVTAVCLSSAMSNQTIGPACDFLAEYQILDCYLIESGSLDVLEDAIQVTSNWSEPSLLITFSTVDDFPDDVFRDASLSSLSFEYNSTMAGIPSRLLRPITSALTRLQFTRVGGIDSIAQTDFQDLPFAADLETLVLQLEELQEISGAPFQSFTSLRQLTVTETSLTVLPQDFLHGLISLQELTITGNPISVLPKNFFAEQNNLKIAWLGENNLQFLEDGALDGLTDIQMLSVSGNPFYCNCSLQWFKDWLTDRELLDASGAVCQYPYVGTFSEIDFCQN